jgi:hypothetical protein
MLIRKCCLFPVGTAISFFHYGNSGFAECSKRCRALFIGPSAQTRFVESLTRQNNTHGVVTFAERPAVGMWGPSAESSLCRGSALGKVGTLGEGTSTLTSGLPFTLLRALLLGRRQRLCSLPRVAAQLSAMTLTTGL